MILFTKLGEFEDILWTYDPTDPRSFTMVNPNMDYLILSIHFVLCQSHDGHKLMLIGLETIQVLMRQMGWFQLHHDVLKCSFLNVMSM